VRGVLRGPAGTERLTYATPLPKLDVSRALYCFPGSKEGAVTDDRTPTMFDESFYLGTNPDVAEAVAHGFFSSGREHYELFGRGEGRAPCKSYIFHIDVFSYCNLRCPSCLVGNKLTHTSEWRRGLMSPDFLGRILDKGLSECAISDVGLYNWTEPMLHPDIVDLVRVVKSRGLRCSISSNLNVLRNPEELLASGLDWIRVSLSGFTQRVYELGHRGGELEIVKDNMRRLAAAKETTGAATMIEVLYHRYRDNHDEIAPMAEFSRSLGFEFKIILAYVTVVEKILTIHAGDCTPQDSLVLDRLAVPLDRAIAITSQIAEDRCTFLEDIIAIDVAGQVMLCCGSSLRPSNVIGNYLDVSLDEIQRRRREHSLCSDCMKLGLPSYFSGHPEFNRIADEVAGSPQGGRG
jgi:MoaA/NifB/PqqE/SkfB family radical SAM enzyme